MLEGQTILKYSKYGCTRVKQRLIRILGGIKWGILQIIPIPLLTRLHTVLIWLSQVKFSVFVCFVLFQILFQ